MRCPDEDMGRNSVRPWMSAKTIKLVKGNVVPGYLLSLCNLISILSKRLGIYLMNLCGSCFFMVNFWEPLCGERGQFPIQEGYRLNPGCLGMPVAIVVD
jgi:hypothetical protein